MHGDNPGTALCPAHLRALRRKYRILLRLRQTREAWEAQQVFAAPAACRQRRACLKRRLAHSFPGALRELEHVNAGGLAGRLAALNTLCDAGGPPPLWLQLIAQYHALLRQGRLARQAWRLRPAAGGASSCPALVQAGRQCYRPGAMPPCVATPSLCAPARQLADGSALPGGRLSSWAIDTLSRQHGLRPSVVRSTLFGDGAPRP